MKWINVKDRLPEVYTSVLIFDGCSIFMGHREHGIFLIDGEITAEQGITHWMPLPEPPGSVL